MHRQPCFPSCATRAVLDLVSEKWVLLVLEHLQGGPVRFLELQRRVGDVSQKSLTQTLRRLERHGIVVRTIFAEVPPRVEYRLTELGRGLTDHLQKLRAWADTHAEHMKLAALPRT